MPQQLCPSGRGGDPRHGNFFTHMVLDRQNEIDAHRAIAMWESREFWKREDGEFSAELADRDVTELTPARAVNDETLTRFASIKENEALFRFALTAHLSGSANRRVVLAARAPNVAQCVYGLTRVLPCGMLKEFSFSTYESQPISSTAHLIGTWWEGNGGDLPSACYEGSYRGYNNISKSKRELAPSEPVPYVDFAVKAIVDRRWGDLDPFRERCERLGVDRPELLNLVYHLEILQGDVTEDDTRLIASNPELAEWIIKQRPAAAKLVVEKACDDPDSGQAVLRSIAAVLPCDSAGRSRLIASAVDLGFSDISALKLDRLNELFEVVLATLGTDESRKARVRLIDEACRACRTPEGQFRPELIRTLVQLRTLALAMIELVGAQSEDGPMGVRLFEALLRQPKQETLVENVLDLVAKLEKPVYDGCLNVALDRERVHVPELVRKRGLDLLALPDESTGLDRIVNWFVDNPLEPAWDDPAVFKFLQSIALRRSKQPIAGDRLVALVHLATFQRKPRLDPDTLDDISKGLDAVAAPIVRRSSPVLSAVVRALAALPEDRDAQGAVEAVLETFGRRGIRPLARVYCWLIQDLSSVPGLWERADVLAALLAPGLGGFRATGLAKQYDVAEPGDRETLLGAAHNLARQAAPHIPSKVLKRIGEIARDWPASAQERWPGLREVLHRSLATKVFQPLLSPVRRNSESSGYLPLVTSLPDPPQRGDRLR